MKYYSTNHKTPDVDLKTAVTQGLALDRGLFMPIYIDPFPESFFRKIETLSFQEMAFEVADKFFGDDIPKETLREIVYETLSFDTPLVLVEDSIYSLELFHGPTLAFKDVGARFMARMLSYFLREDNNKVHVLVATSGDTGSAVANGFLDVPGIHVHVLYPKGKVSDIQEKQFTTLGKNITAIEIAGTFDDCQALVKSAFMDAELKNKLTITSANSINVARFIPQAFYYFNAYAKLADKNKKIVISVPSGNFGNLTSGLIAKKMGLPIYRFIAANNRNNVVYKYLKTGIFEPRESVATLANAMDVGNPSNFARILDLYEDDYKAIVSDITGFTCSDEKIMETIEMVFTSYGYLLDPHGAVGYRALKEKLNPGENGIFLETAHPSKFTNTVEKLIGKGKVPMPQRLKEFMKGKKVSLHLNTDYNKFRDYLLKLS
jgi:threonine synthase